MPDFIEGGGPRPPYHESFLENIVNVHWQSVGGVFVSGDECCYERYTRYPDNKKVLSWIGLGPMSFTTGGTTLASAYGKTKDGPVFLMGGSTNKVGGATIMRSTDGYTWTTPFGHVNGVFDNVSALVWDEKANRFFALISSFSDTAGTKYVAYSPDGIFWFFSGDNFFDHCHGIIPDTPMGVYGYDSSADVIIYPDGEGNAIAVVNASFMDAEEFMIWTGVPYVSCVAYAGGIWHAGGGTTHFNSSITATSLNGGEDWVYSTFGNIGMAGDFAVLTMVGAPIQHFKASSKDPKIVPADDFSEFFIPAPQLVARQSQTFIPVARQDNASRPQQSRHGIMAAAISPPRAPRTRLRRHQRTI
jgi:hypothetical protein